MSDKKKYLGETSLGQLVANIISRLNNKVDKISGKGLSTNDYTTAEKNKLSGIEDGAQKNTVTGIKGNSESSYRTGDVNITPANIGLGNVNNTSDANKPVSTAQQTAIDTALSEANKYTDTKTSGLASTSSVNTSISAHNTSTSAHGDIRTLITDLATKLNNFLDVDDTTTDQLSEVITLIENNKGTLESLTTSKINVSDIVDNLTTSSTSKVLSAKQGVAIKTLIDTLQAELDAHTHEIADVSGLQSAIDGVNTIAVSTTEPTDDNVQVWINPDVEETASLPEIKDDTTNSDDTWSSNKISTEISNVQTQVDELNTNISNTKTKNVTDKQTISVASGTTAVSATLFTAPEDGLYMIDVSVSFPSNSSGFRRAGIDTQLISYQIPAAYGYPTNIPIDQTVYLGKGTNLKIWLMQNSGSTLDVTVQAKYSYIKL